MQVETIQMDPRIARIHYKDYMERCRKHRDVRKSEVDAKAKEAGRALGRARIEKTLMEKEDLQLLKAYKALMKAGTRLLHLPTVIRSGGFDKAWLPKLAVARASAKSVVFYAGWTPYFDGSPWESKVNNRVDIPRGIFPAEVTNEAWRKDNRHPNRATALVPAIPPNLRPDDLTKFHILWEAEWSFRAPGDPLLLSQVNDNTYAVVAQWDLTPLEQRILESRTL